MTSMSPSTPLPMVSLISKAVGERNESILAEVYRLWKEDSTSPSLTVAGGFRGIWGTTREKVSSVKSLRFGREPYRTVVTVEVVDSGGGRSRWVHEVEEDVKMKWQFMHGVAQQDTVACHIHTTIHHTR